MSTTREQGLEVLRKLLPDLPFDDDGELPAGNGFASGLLDETLRVRLRAGVDPSGPGLALTQPGDARNPHRVAGRG